jgi:hypothetical protein
MRTRAAARGGGGRPPRRRRRRIESVSRSAAAPMPPSGGARNMPRRVLPLLPLVLVLALALPLRPCCSSSGLEDADETPPSPSLPWPPPAAGGGVVGSAGTDLEHIMGRDGPGGKWIVESFSGTVTVPGAPREPQSLNGAGFSVWPGLLVGDQLLQPCLTLHRQIFPGNTFFSRMGGTGSHRLNLTHQMAGCCYTEGSPYFMGLWGYQGSSNVVANRWISRHVTKIFWNIRASQQPNASFGGDRYDYEVVWQGLDAAGEPVENATQSVLVETRASKMQNGTRRSDAGKSYGLQLNNEIFSGLPFRAPQRHDETAVELWPFLPSTNVYFANLSVSLANEPRNPNAGGGPAHPVPFFVHGNPANPCRGVYFNQRAGGRELSICYPNNWASDPGCWPAELQPLNCSATIAASFAQDQHYRPITPAANRSRAEFYAGLPQKFADQHCALDRFHGRISRLPGSTAFSDCLAACEDGTSESTFRQCMHRQPAIYATQTCMGVVMADLSWQCTHGV